MSIFLNNAFITHYHCSLHNVNFILVTYRDQNNGERMETVTLFCTNNNTMCPVRQAAALVLRLRHNKRTTNNNTVDTFVITSG